MLPADIALNAKRTSVCLFDENYVVDSSSDNAKELKLRTTSTRNDVLHINV